MKKIFLSLMIICSGCSMAQYTTGKVGVYTSSSRVTIINNGTNGQVLTTNGTGVGWVAGSGWNLTGNSGTSPGTNFVGTTDNVALEFKVNSVFSGYIGTSATHNTFLGFNCGTNVSSGTLNSFYGNGAGLGVSTASNCVDVGQVAQGGTGANGSNSAHVGVSAGQYDKGSNNSSVGYQAMFAALNSTNTGSSNWAGGAHSLFNLNTGMNNTATGYNALGAITGASSNVAVGYYAGFGQNSDSNVYVGDSATGSSSNQMAFGYKANNTIRNSCLIGGSNFTFCYLAGKAAYGKPVQYDSSTSGTVVANGAQVLDLIGAAAALTITDPASPHPGQEWQIITNQSGITLTFTNPGNFVAAPPSIGTITSAHFIWAQQGAGVYKWQNE